MEFVITKEFKKDWVIFSLNDKPIAWFTIEWYQEYERACKKWELLEMEKWMTMKD